MKIALLRERERFRELFSAAAKAALATLFDYRGGVEFRERPAWPGARHWLCNSQLNAIYHPHATDAVKLAVRQHYGHSENTGKRLLQRLYVRTSAARLGEYLLADDWLELQPLPARRTLLFRGGGQRYRLFDYKSGVVHALPKCDDSRWTERELELRGRLPDDFPAPAITAGPRAGIAYTEALTAGAPLDQLPEDERESHWHDIAVHLGRLAERTARTSTSAEYLDEIGARVESRLQSPVATAPLATQVRATLTAASQSLTNGDTVDMAVAHGDLHAGNVLWSQHGAVLMDWEFVEERPSRTQVVDRLIGGHHAVGFSNRLAEFVRRKPTPTARAFSRAITGGDGISDMDWRAAAAAELVIEKLDNHARTALAHHLDRPGEELALYCREAERFCRRAVAA